MENEFSFFSITAPTATNTNGAVFCNSASNAARIVQYVDSRPNTEPNYGRNVIVSDGTSVNFDMSAARPGTDQVLKSFFNDAGLGYAWDNGVQGALALFPNGNYINDIIRIGEQFNNQTGMSGDFQEMVFFSSDNRGDRVGIENNVNDHYSIF